MIMEKVTKKEYKAPQVELLEFETRDIITTSGFFGVEDEFPVGDAANTNELPGDYNAG